MLKLACPKCHKPLSICGNSYKCEDGHCYDIAKSKYINLLLNPDKSTNNPGDNKESLLCRKAHLNAGYYDCILNNVVECIKEFKNSETMHILDLGCGEGGYSRELAKRGARLVSVDCSTKAIEYATYLAKEENLQIEHFVRNSNDLFDIE